jgi:general secretion pathway protein E
MNAPVFEYAAGIAAREIAQARGIARNARRRLVDVLEEQLAQAPDVYLPALGATVGWPVLSMDALRRATPLFDLLPFTECSQRCCVPLRDGDGAALLAADDPFNGELRDWAQERITTPFTWALVHRGDLVAFLASHEEMPCTLDSIGGTGPRTGKEREHHEDLSLQAISGESSEVVRQVRSTLRDALRSGASDIHLETVAGGLVIKLRIDGILSPVKTLVDTQQAAQTLARVKVLSELDVTERRVPQDGRFKAVDGAKAVDFRVSVMPSIHGEDAVLRVLDKQSLRENDRQQLSLDALGFEDGEIRLLRRLSREPYGMLLVTGPTGSGKTTTLYAAISEINNGQDKIITIEDPVEYQLPGVLQIPVNDKKGLTFARGLRSILRHDPDKIMIGEIRDPETANIAVQSALTGHLVFTTVHANNVFDVIGRFMHMDVDLHGLVSALNAILAQRLVRLICPHCARAHEPDAALLAEARIGDATSWHFRTGRGCRECRGSGYKGRMALAELMILNDEMRELITARAPVRQLKEAARHAGTRLLRDAALDAVRQGKTTLEEINRVTFVA